MAEPIQDDGWRIPDALWEQIEPLIPLPPKIHPWGAGVHKPRVPDRQVLDGIFFHLRTGCQWKALDATGICSGSTAHRRYQEWEQAGFFQELWQAGLEVYDQEVGIDWRWQAMDGVMLKAPLGGKKNRTQSHRPGQIRHETQCGGGRTRSAGGRHRGRSQRAGLPVGGRNAGEPPRGTAPARATPG